VSTVIQTGHITTSYFVVFVIKQGSNYESIWLCTIVNSYNLWFWVVDV